MVKSPSPKRVENEKCYLKILFDRFKIIEKIAVTNITEHIVRSCIQKTGTSNNKSLTVPPPTDVINAIITTPKGSNLLCIAAKDPDIAKEIVPRISIMKLNCSCIIYDR